ncbi:MAG: hypothetical protein ABL921_21685 [Pirellula sp.]
MSTRSRNDLIGCSGRMRSTLSKWRETSAIVEESWNDSTAKGFYHQSLGTVEPVFNRMMASLQDAAELVRSIEKKVADPGMFN